MGSWRMSRAPKTATLCLFACAHRELHTHTGCRHPKITGARYIYKYATARALSAMALVPGSTPGTASVSVANASQCQHQRPVACLAAYRAIYTPGHRSANVSRGAMAYFISAGQTTHQIVRALHLLGHMPHAHNRHTYTRVIKLANNNKSICSNTRKINRYFMTARVTRRRNQSHRTQNAQHNRVQLLLPLCGWCCTTIVHFGFVFARA